MRKFCSDNRDNLNFAARIKPYINIIGSLDFDDDVVVSYLLAERNHQTDAAVIVHLDEWIALIEQGSRARAYAEALAVIAKLERGSARLKIITGRAMRDLM